MQLTVTYGHMQSEQQMMEETMLQPEIMMYAQYQDFVQLREYQLYQTPTSLWMSCRMNQIMTNQRALTTGKS